MFNKKTTIIIISAVIIFSASATLVFWLARETGDKVIVNQADSNITNELKNNSQGLRSDRNSCHDLEHQDEARYKECINDIIKQTAREETGKCELLAGGDDYYSCLWNIFDIYNGRENCIGLADLGARAVCQDIFSYQTAYAKYDRELCQTIKNEKLNQYCLKNIIDKK